MARLGRHAQSNQLANVDACLLDWSQPPDDGTRWPLIVGSDIIYSQAAGEALGPSIRGLLAPGGVFLGVLASYRAGASEAISSLRREFPGSCRVWQPPARLWEGLARRNQWVFLKGGYS